MPSPTSTCRASQVRRRLKGFGHGVRKVESAGRNQAVIVHTATGRHLDELARQFAVDDLEFVGKNIVKAQPLLHAAAKVVKAAGEDRQFITETLERAGHTFCAFR